mgnify:CR=1 FL=1
MSTYIYFKFYFRRRFSNKTKEKLIKSFYYFLVNKLGCKYNIGEPGQYSIGDMEFYCEPVVDGDSDGTKLLKAINTQIEIKDGFREIFLRFDHDKKFPGYGWFHIYHAKELEYNIPLPPESESVWVIIYSDEIDYFVTDWGNPSEQEYTPQERCLLFIDKIAKPIYYKYSCFFGFSYLSGIDAYEPLIEMDMISWVTFFGPEFVKKFGKEKLLTTPAYKVEELKDGSILLIIEPTPYVSLENRLKVAKHLGIKLIDPPTEY